ncbi:MAG: YqgE/AlgH family protein [Opitutales bacterium]|nr:YqgE/AlgH family protein [Opitutales bacterium]
MAKNDKDKLLWQNLSGKFLLSMPHLAEEPFRRAVIWLPRFDADGALGFVLSSPMGKTLGSASICFTGTPAQHLPLMCGGPVEPEQLAIIGTGEDPVNHRWSVSSNMELDEELFKSLQFRPDAICMAFSGRAEWAPGQLEDELKRKTWISLPADFVETRHFFAEVELDARREDRRDFKGVLWSRILAKQSRPDFRALSRLPYEKDDLNDS